MLGLLNFTSFVSSSGYVAIFLLCVAQSCCVPTSSELTMGFAGVLAASGKLNLAAVIAIGTAGEVVGAYVAWVIGRTGGRRFVDRWGEYLLLICIPDLDRAEALVSATRALGRSREQTGPVRPQLCGPSGGRGRGPPRALRSPHRGRQPHFRNGAMAGVGYGVGSQWKAIMHGFSDVGYVIAALAVLGIAVVIWHRYRSYRAATERRATVTETGVAEFRGSVLDVSLRSSLEPQSASSNPLGSQPAAPPD